MSRSSLYVALKGSDLIDRVSFCSPSLKTHSRPVSGWKSILKKICMYICICVYIYIHIWIYINICIGLTLTLDLESVPSRSLSTNLRPISRLWTSRTMS